MRIFIVNPFPALTTPFQQCFFSNLCNTDKISLVPNLGKTSLGKETTRFISAFLYNLPSTLHKILPRNLPD